jgi:hypothetical protein
LPFSEREPVWCALIRETTLLYSLNSYPEKPQPINWDHYRKNVAVPGLVDSFLKQYEGLSVPYPKDTTSASIDKREREVVGLCGKGRRVSRGCL